MLVVILVETQLPENLGAVARVMANFGLTELRLVRPQVDPFDPKALATAVGAAKLLRQARVISCLEEAITDLHYIFGTSACQRDMIKIYETPRSFAAFATHALKSQSLTGVVFGPERTGLTNDDLARCERIIQVPVDPNFSSLNLAQAVGMISYEFYQAKTSPFGCTFKVGQTKKADQKQIGQFLHFLEKNLDDVNFWRVASKKPVMWRNLQSLWTRTNLTEQEIQTLYGMITSLRGWVPIKESNKQ